MTYSMRRQGLLSDCAEGDVQNGVLAPVLVIVMPPRVWFDGEAFGRHHLAQLDEISATGRRRIFRRALLGEKIRGEQKTREYEQPWHQFSFTGLPLTKTYLIADFSSNSSPSVTITFAILPRSRDPSRSPAPASVAAFKVNALIAASFDSPLATVFCAFFRKSFGSANPFDSNANSTPALSSAAGPFGALARSRSTLSDSSASGASDGRRVGKFRL